VTENESNYLSSSEQGSEEENQSPSMQAVVENADPDIVVGNARNAAEGKSPNASGGAAASTTEDYVGSTSDPNPTSLPSSDHPLPDDADNPDEETKSSSLSGNGSNDKYTH
jgi:hypothetical protein